MQDTNLIVHLRSLSDQELLSSIHQGVATEKRSTLTVLYHLREVNRRKLHIARGSSDLYIFATRTLGYSPGAAQRRIQAMLLLCEIPELEEKIQNGKITLDVAAKAQSFFKQEPKSFSIQEKRGILFELEDHSSRDCERKLASMSSQPERFLRPDLVKPVSESHSEIRFVASEELVRDLERVRELFSHKNPSMKMAELIGEMAQLTLKKLDPMRRAEPVRKTTRIAKSKSKVPDAATERFVLKRDHYCCTYRDPITGQICGSRFLLELDHLLPVALGGESTTDNLRVRCRSHNQWYAVQVYGARKMARAQSLRKKINPPPQPNRSNSSEVTLR